MAQINAFTIPIWTFNFPQHEELKQRYIDYASDSANWGRVLDHIKFGKATLHQEPLFKNFTDFVQLQTEWVMSQMGFQPQAQITSLWTTLQPPGGRHHRHAHGNSFLAGVYYLSGAPETRGTTFYNPAVASQVIIPARIPGLNLMIAHRYVKEFVPGQLVIFPAWLEHQTDPNLTQQDRIILGFNAMPVGQTTHDPFDRYVYQDMTGQPFNENY
jgi:uncharacterized protein (TIGR02466 family)